MKVIFEEGEKFSFEAVAEKLGLESDWNADGENWAAAGEEIEPIEIGFAGEPERSLRRYRYEAGTPDPEEQGRRI